VSNGPNVHVRFGTNELFLGHDELSKRADFPGPRANIEAT
jgi:hypothetical protein